MKHVLGHRTAMPHLMGPTVGPDCRCRHIEVYRGPFGGGLTSCVRPVIGVIPDSGAVSSK